MDKQTNLEFNEEPYNEPLFEEEISTEDEILYENEDLVVAKKLNNSNIIKNFSYDQTEILHNIGILYNNGSDQFDADMTASSLGFYNKGRGYAYSIPLLSQAFPDEVQQCSSRLLRCL